MNLKAIFIGIGSYFILLSIWFFIAPQYEHKTLHIYSIIISSIYIFLPFISGYITAAFAEQKLVLNGLTFAIIVAILSAIGWFILDILSIYLLFNLLSIILLGTAGAMVNYWLNKKSSTSSA
ncbi:MAG: hypothetical protein QM479_16645 [Pseudomonadota bacterium]